MAFYISLFFLAFLFSAHAEIIKTRNNTILFLFCATLAIIIGSRHQVGGDWENYQVLFYSIAANGPSDAIKMTDPAYGAINWIANSLNLKIYFVNSVCASIFSYGLYRYCAAQIKPWNALCIAIPYITTAVAMGYTRQSAALGFVFLLITAIQNKKTAKSITFAIASCLFHKSAAFCLIFLFALQSKYKISVNLVFAIIIASSLSALAAPHFEQISGLYLSGDVNSEGGVIRLTMNLISALIFFIVKDQWSKKWPDSYKVTYLLAIASLSIFPIGFFFSTLADRLAIYLTPIQISVYAGLPLLVRHKWRAVVMIAIVLSYLLTYLVWLTMSPWAKCCWMPYKSFLLL